MKNPAPVVIDPDLLIRAHELVHVGTWTWQVASNTVYWSDELFRLYGVEPQSIPLSLEAYLSFVHPDDRERVRSTITKSLEGRAPYQFDHTILVRGGSPRVFHARGNVICDEAGNVTHLLGTSQDVTDRVREQEAMRKSEERFRSLFEQSGVGMALTDASKRFIRVNASFARFLGYEPLELEGRTFVEITHPDDVEMTVNLIKKNELSRSSFTYEKRYLRKDGATVWARATVTRLREADGTLDGYMGVVEDITESRVASESLRRQTELLQSVMDHLPVMISMFDASGRPTYVNREWQRTFGWTLAEAQSVDLLKAIYPDDAEAARAREIIGVGGARWTDFEPQTRDGKKIPSSWASISLSDGTSLTIGQDISERRRLEQRLAQAQKMEALGQLAGGVAHDFNNVLTIISACATFILEAVGSNESVASDLREIQSATQRAAALTRQLLAFSRRQMLHPEIVDVNITVQGLAKSLNRLVGENIHIAVVTAATTPTVEVDVHQLEQVLLNLVVNARDAIGDTGTITIETSDAKRPPSDPKRRDSIIISVSDDGCGIEPAIRDRIFEPFFTTKPVGKGTGLGLATVHGIVEQSGGRIDVESTIGQGTTFRIYLPVINAGQCRIVGDTDDEDLRGTETVLLVEDEAALRAVGRRVLGGLGYTVLEARHGADAVALSATYKDPIHLLVTDVVMPELGGREMARLVRKQRPGIPVLYVSGYTDDELLRKGILETGAQLLRKPFMPAELARVVRQMLRSVKAAA